MDGITPIFLSVYSSIALFWIIAVITPGPNFFLIATTALQLNKKAALLAVLGILSGTLLWIFSGFLGITLLFHIAPWSYYTIKILGCTYLIFTGINLIKSKNNNESQNRKCSTRTIKKMHIYYGKGLLVNISNPKTAIFVSSLFATIVPKD